MMGVNLLGKIKIHEIAKKLGLTSKEILEIATNLKIEAKSHLSGVTEEEANKIENEILSQNKNIYLQPEQIIVFESQNQN